MGKLTAVAVRAAKHDPSKGKRPVRIGDGDGLYLQIAYGGGKSWLFRYMLGGRSREMGLGSVETVPLAAARQLAAEAKRRLVEGKDPIEARQEAARAAEIELAQARANTFRAVAERYVDAHEAGWRNPKHRAQWRSTLATYAYPELGDMPVRDIGTADVMRVLTPVWQDKPETASRLRGRIEAVLDAATAEGLRSGENPARWRGHLAKLLPARGKLARVRHHPALAWKEIGAFMAALRKREATAARALEFGIFTAARTGEVRGARWSEVNLDEKLWVIPAERMKAGREHRVPLTAAAIQVLRACNPPPAGKDRSGYIFPGAKAKTPLSEMALEMLLRRMNEVPKGKTQPWRDQNGEPIVPHGFRSTFRDWCGEATNYPRELAEAALAHSLRDKVEAAYRRGDALEKRRKLMEDWAAFCTRSGESDRGAPSEQESQPAQAAE